jgi:hypothetical protein
MIENYASTKQLEKSKMKTTRPIFPSPPPTFSSDRLLFRPVHDSDAEDYHAIRTDIELMKWTSTAKCDPDIEATRVWSRDP